MATSVTPTTYDPDDPFFSLEQEGEWNACIGVQGNAENYVDGYIEAALELAGAVIDKNNLGSRDTLAMPILYNGRHGLELALKFVINTLHDAGAFSAAAAKNHDIKALWTTLSTAKVGDAEIRRLVADLAPYVESLHAIDEDGQQLRYAHTRQGKPSLESKAICDLALVRESLKAMGELLRTLKGRVHQFAQERATGTHTRNCSRADLAGIAACLPPHAEWGTEAFAAAKQNVMSDRDLSAEEFDAATKLIEAHRELGSSLGIEFVLCSLSDEHAVLVVEHWRTAHPEEPSTGVRIVSAASVSADVIAARMQALNEAVNAVIAALSPAELADVEVIYYLGAFGGFSEHYAERLAGVAKEYVNEAGRRGRVRHIIAKGNLADALAAGVETLGRRALAARLRDAGHARLG